MTHEEAKVLASQAKEAKADALGYGDEIMVPNSEAAKLADFASRARVQLQYAGYWTLADTI